MGSKVMLISKINCSLWKIIVSEYTVYNEFPKNAPSFRFKDGAH